MTCLVFRLKLCRWSCSLFYLCFFHPDNPFWGFGIFLGGGVNYSKLQGRSRIQPTQLSSPTRWPILIHTTIHTHIHTCGQRGVNIEPKKTSVINKDQTTDLLTVRQQLQPLSKRFDLISCCSNKIQKCLFFFIQSSILNHKQMFPGQ